MLRIKYYIFGLGMGSNVANIHERLVKLRKLFQNLQEREQTPTDTLTHGQFDDLINKFTTNLKQKT